MGSRPVTGFGDLFLADVRAYREAALAGSGITPLFPLRGRRTDELAREMIAAGVRAVITCVDPAQLAPRYAGATSTPTSWTSSRQA